MKFCPNCGAPQPQTQAAAPSQPQQWAAPPPPKPKKPTWVTRFSRSNLIAGILVFVFGALFFLVASAVAQALGLILILLGTLSIALRFGIKDARAWAKQLGLLAGVSYVALGALQLVTATVVSVAVGLAFVVWGVFLVYYLRQPRAKEYLSS